MSVEHISITKIAYERPVGNDITKCDWTFRAELSAPAPHGHPVMGGILKSIGDGVWRARGNASEIWGRPANSRQKAIQNALPDGLLGLQEFKKKMETEDRIRQERHEQAARLGSAFSQWPNVSVSDENAFHTDRPSMFRVAIDGLQPSQVQLLSELLASSGVDIRVKDGVA